tara:strand:+ start:1162 stop:1572 length:411 start_codon:yes stop_codon:yes gene_type:complete
MSLQLEIVTPEASVYNSTVDSVVMPTTTGEVGIMPGHIPLVTEIQAGEIVVQNNGKSESLAVSKGFAQCVGDKVSILADDAITLSAIDENEVASAQKRAEDSLKNAESMTEEEINLLETTIAYSKAQLWLLHNKKR